MIEKERYDEVEIYFGLSYEEVEDWFLHLMCRIQVAYENGTIGKDISYYAAMYGY